MDKEKLAKANKLSVVIETCRTSVDWLTRNPRNLSTDNLSTDQREVVNKIILGFVEVNLKDAEREFAEL
jgi:hypothetical protein